MWLKSAGTGLRTCHKERRDAAKDFLSTSMIRVLKKIATD